MTNEKTIEILKELWRYSNTDKYRESEIREAIMNAIKAVEAVDYDCADCKWYLEVKKNEMSKEDRQVKDEEIGIIKSAIEHYGMQLQTVVAIEEMAELQKELTKFLRGQGNKKELTEEVADVLIMIMQIQLMYYITDDEVERIMHLKLNRLKERMEQNANVGKMSEKKDGDLISRESVITMLQKIENAVEDGEGFQFNEWVEYAKDIPNAEKTAVFKIVGNTKQPYECSKCNEPVDGWDKYCKHCGARLVL